MPEDVKFATRCGSCNEEANQVAVDYRRVYDPDKEKVAGFLDPDWEELGRRYGCDNHPEKDKEHEAVWRDGKRYELER